MIGSVAGPPRNETQPGRELSKLIDGFVDQAPGLTDLFAHRLASFAAARLRALSRPVPAPLLEEERFGAVAYAVTPVLLNRITTIYSERFIVLKGPAVA